MSVMDAKFAVKCAKVHKQAVENWSDGKREVKWIYIEFCVIWKKALG